MTLDVSSISKRYGAIVALNDVSLRVRPGEVRALYGGNGSGKSTIAKIIAGTTPPDSGGVTVNGCPVPPGAPGSSRAAGLAVTFQELSLLPELTVAENLALVRAPRWGGIFCSRTRIRQQAEAALGRFDLAHLAPLPVFALQVGEKYLVELAKALLSEPSFLVFDELTSALHEHEAAQAKMLLREHVTRGGGAVLVSHRVDEVLQLCDTITVLRNGHCIHEGDIGSVSTEHLVRWVSSPRGQEIQAAPRPARSTDTRLLVENLVLAPGTPPFSAGFGSGEIVGLGGLPDQGQDDILALLAGTGKRRNATASVTLDNQPLYTGSPTQALRSGIVFVSGDRDAVGFPIRSLKENMVSALLNIPGRQAPSDEELENALRALGTVHGGLSLALNTLSGGNQQKVLLSRCFLLEPSVLLAADPTKGIDVAARAEVHAALRAMADQHGMTVILTSSDDRELAAVCDRVIVMEKRCIVRQLQRANGTLTEETLIASYMHQENAA